MIVGATPNIDYSTLIGYCKMRLRGAAIAAFAVAASSCAPVQVPQRAAYPLEQLNRLVLIGEVHGTAESPAEFGRIVSSLATSGSPLDVGVELPERALAVSCGTSGGPGNPFWSRPRQDGRTSMAMWRLVCDLRQLQAQGRLALFGLVPDGPPLRSGSHPYLAGVTSRLRPGSPRMVLLLGNFHARRVGDSLAAQLSQAGIPLSTITVSSRSASAWNCRPEGCRPQVIPLRFCRVETDAVRLLLGAEAGLNMSQEWDGCLVFPAMTPSPPAEPSPRVEG